MSDLPYILMAWCLISYAKGQLSHLLTNHLNILQKLLEKLTVIQARIDTTFLEPEGLMLSPQELTPSCTRI
jgi:hypothetical protein